MNTDADPGLFLSLPSLLSLSSLGKFFCRAGS